MVFQMAGMPVAAWTPCFAAKAAPIDEIKKAPSGAFFITHQTKDQGTSTDTVNTTPGL